MKYLWCVVAVAMSGMAMAGVNPAQVTGPPTAPTGRSANPLQHRPLIEVKFVLVRPAPEPSDTPSIDLGNQQPAIVPLWLIGRDATPFRGKYVNPNMYWCSAWGCMETSH